MSTENYHSQFIHNVFGCFIENTLEYFADYLYPRFKHSGVATYDKAVEYIRNKEKLGREGDKPNLPALFLNPSGDMNLDDAQSLAKQLWRFPHLNKGVNLANRLFKPIYKDNNVELNIAFTRLKGEFELLALLPSFYEYFDLKLFIIQHFGGEGRPIEPLYFNDFITLPEELINYKYENNVTGESYTLDWLNNGAYEFLVETTNQNELIVPGKLKPRFTLRGMSDGSERYGGTDSMASWKLSTIVEYEIEIPTFMILTTDNMIENIDFNIRFGSIYTKYEDYNLPINEITIERHWDSGIDESRNALNNETTQSNPNVVDDLNSNTITSSINDPNIANNDYPKGYDPGLIDICKSEKFGREKVFKTRYFHEVTQEQADSTSNIIIELPEKIFNPSLIKVQSKYGLLDYGDHYKLSDDGSDLTIVIEYVELNKGDFVEIFVYAGMYGVQNPIFVYGGSSLISTTDESPYRTSLNIDGGLIGVADVTFIEEFADINLSLLSLDTLRSRVNTSTNVFSSTLQININHYLDSTIICTINSSGDLT